MAKIQAQPISNPRLSFKGWFERSFRWLVHLAALAPFAWTAWLTATGGLTINPIQDLTLRTGKAALVLLLTSLACTPVNLVFGFKPALKARRTLGLYAFLYAALHFLIFVGLDYTFNLSLIWSGITEKRFVLAGLAAFILLSLLALTSFTWWQKRMGKRWKQLHRLVYLAGILVIVHYIWLVKADIRPPLLFGALLLVLLALRLPAVRKRVANWRSSLR